MTTRHDPRTRLLGVNDRILLEVHRTLRGIGYPGFETQALVWLNGRVNVAGLRASLIRLGRLYPVVTARLVEPANGSGTRWQFRPDGETALQEISLGSGNAEAVLDHAGHLL